MHEVYIAVLWAVCYSAIVTVAIMRFYALGWKVYTAFFKQENHSREFFSSKFIENK